MRACKGSTDNEDWWGRDRVHKCHPDIEGELSTRLLSDDCRLVWRGQSHPSSTATWQRMSPVAPRCGVAPAPNGSVLLVFKWIASCVGLLWESSNISSGESISGVKASCKGYVNSPALMNLKILYNLHNFPFCTVQSWSELEHHELDQANAHWFPQIDSDASLGLEAKWNGGLCGYSNPFTFLKSLDGYVASV